MLKMFWILLYLKCYVIFIKIRKISWIESSRQSCCSNKIMLYHFVRLDTLNPLQLACTRATRDVPIIIIREERPKKSLGITGHEELIDKPHPIRTRAHYALKNSVDDAEIQSQSSKILTNMTISFHLRTRRTRYKLP